MNATTQAKTRNVYVRDIMMPVVFCKECKYKVETEDGEWNPEDIVCDYWASDGLEADDFCSRGVRKGEKK